MRMLVVEDSQSLVADLFEYFEPLGHVLDIAPDGLTGYYLAGRHDYDVIVLDWNLPRLDGREVLRRLRESGSEVPVVMLTARNELPDKISGFRAGADDYLTKPFDLQELEVRVEALLVRSQGRRGGRGKVLKVGDLRYDPAALEAVRGERVLHLYPAGRKLLEVLMRASPAAVTRERLERALWGDDPPDGDMLRWHIYELRRSIDGPFKSKLLTTLPRSGYRIADPTNEGSEP